MRTFKMHVLMFPGLLVLVLAQCALVSPAPIDSEEFWWHNPCSTPVRSPTKRHLRHAKSPQETAIKRVLNTYKSEVQPYLEKLVGQDYNKSQIKKIPWLPEKPNLKNRKTLHKQLSKYAATIHKLIIMNVSSQDGANNLTRRMIVLEKTKEELKGLICEVEHNFNMTSEKRNLTRDSLPHYTPRQLRVNVPLQADSTATIMEDYSLLTKFGDFLEIYEKKLKGMERRKRKRRKRQKLGLEPTPSRSENRANRPRKNRQRKGRRKRVRVL